MNFFNIPAIENDEYIYSYVLRLANANGFDLKTFLQVVLDQVWGYERKRAYDLDLDIVKISELIGLERALPFYLKTTLFNGIAPFMNRDNIGKRVNAVNYYVFSNMKTLEGYEHLLNDLKICPECMKEELESKNFFYYHRAHQMPSVEVCHKHNCRLKIVDCDYGNEFVYPLNLIEVEDTIITNKKGYANFCYDLLQSDLDISSQTVKTTIYKKTGNYNKDWSHKDLILMCFELYGNVETFENNCKSAYPYSFAFGNDILSNNEYRLLNGCSGQKGQFYDHRIIELIHNECGTRFISTPYRMLQGFGCPYCDSKREPDELFKSTFENTINSKHNLFSEYEDVRQPSRKSEGTFEIVEYKGYDNIKLKHSVCGKTFKTGRKNFLTYPWCKECKKRLKTPETFRKDVFDLVGNEYSVVKDYVSEKETITLIHNTCGRELTCYPRHFMSGQRCHVCSQKPIVEMFIERLKLDYKTDDIIFLEDIDYSGQFAEKSKTYISKAEKKGLIRKLAPGIYTFSNNEILEKEIYENKYLIRNGERIGYYKGLSFAYDIGLTPTRPDITSICYNNEAGAHGRTKVYFGIKTKIHSTPVAVNNQNWPVIATMDFLKSAKSNGFDYNQLGLLKDWLTSKNIKIDDFDDYYRYFKPWIRNKVITLYEEN